MLKSQTIRNHKWMNTLMRQTET